MRAVIHAWAYHRFIELQSNLRRLQRDANQTQEKETS